MGDAAFFIEFVLIVGLLLGLALREYLKTSKLLNEANARDLAASAKPSDEAS